MEIILYHTFYFFSAPGVVKAVVGGILDSALKSGLKYDFYYFQPNKLSTSIIPIKGLDTILSGIAYIYNFLQYT